MKIKNIVACVAIIVVQTGHARQAIISQAIPKKPPVNFPGMLITHVMTDPTIKKSLDHAANRHSDKIIDTMSGFFKSIKNNPKKSAAIAGAVAMYGIGYYFREDLIFQSITTQLPLLPHATSLLFFNADLNRYQGESAKKFLAKVMETNAYGSDLENKWASAEEQKQALAKLKQLFSYGLQIPKDWDREIILEENALADLTNITDPQVYLNVVYTIFALAQGTLKNIDEDVVTTADLKETVIKNLQILIAYNPEILTYRAPNNETLLHLAGKVYLQEEDDSFIFDTLLDTEDKTIKQKLSTAILKALPLKDYTEQTPFDAALFKYGNPDYAIKMIDFVEKAKNTKKHDACMELLNLGGKNSFYHLTDGQPATILKDTETSQTDRIKKVLDHGEVANYHIRLNILENRPYYFGAPVLEQIARNHKTDYALTLVSNLLQGDIKGENPYFCFIIKDYETFWGGNLFHHAAENKDNEKFIEKLANIVSDTFIDNLLKATRGISGPNPIALAFSISQTRGKKFCTALKKGGISYNAASIALENAFNWLQKQEWDKAEKAAEQADQDTKKSKKNKNQNKTKIKKKISKAESTWKFLSTPKKRQKFWDELSLEK